MSATQVVVFLCVCAAVIGAGIIISLHQTLQTNDAARKMAQRLGGTYSEAGMFGDPSVEFTLAGRQAWVEFFSGGRDGPPYTRVVVNVRDRSPGTLHIVPEGFAPGFLQIFEEEDLEIGDPDFDRRYVVKARPESLALEVFRPMHRAQAIASVLRLAALEAPTIDLDQNHLTVQARDCVTDAELLTVMVKTAEDFLAYIVQSPSPSGIHVVEVRVATRGRCAVCGTEMRPPLVRCEFCRTPHHAECWKYMGRCSTYACKGRRSVA